MAKATARIIPKVVTAEVKDGVTLELSHAEARTLAEILARVGGIPEITARGYAENISYALLAAGYDDVEPPEGVKLTEKDSCSIYFTPASRAHVEAPL